MKSWEEVLSEEEIKAFDEKKKEIDKKIIELRFIDGVSCPEKNSTNN